MKYGFVYIWYDRKYKRYYIGCRWGSEDDGYICSSSWMKQAYKHRPQDFKRRVISRVYTNRNDLLEQEYQWLSKIKPDELRGERYYNFHNYHFGHWTTDEEKTLSIKEKLSRKAKQNHSNPEWRIKYEEGLKSRNNRSSDLEVREKRRKSMMGKNTGRAKTEAFFKAMEKRKGKTTSDLQKQRTTDLGNFKRLNSTRVKCMYCGVEGNVGTIARYHNNKCKQKELQV